MTETNQQASKFIEYAWGATASEHAEYQCVGIPYFQRGRFLSEQPEHASYVPMYRSVQVYEHTESNGIEGKSGLLYRPIGYDFIPFDTDCPDIMEAIYDARKLIKWLELYGAHSYSIYWSGSKGIHITIPYSDLTQEFFDYSPAILRTFVERYVSVLSKVKTLDSSVYNNRSLFRVENTRNAKTGFYKIPLTRDELFFSDIGELETLALTPRHGFIHEPKQASDYSSLANIFRLATDIVQMNLDKPMQFRDQGSVIDAIPFVEDFVLDARLAPGTRHSVSLLLASYYRARGYTHAETDEALADFMKRCTGSATRISQRIAESKNDVRACYARDIRFSYYRAKEMFSS